MFRAANMPAVQEWTNSAWLVPERFVRFPRPEDDTSAIARWLRPTPRLPSASTKAAVLLRDGYRCRYCGLPVIDAVVRKIANRLYPEAVPWDWKDPWNQHAAFQCLWLQYDHVMPHSHGGPSTPGNMVVSCAVCNFGKDRFTLKQLGLSDPRLRPPAPDSWDGLNTLLKFRPALPPRIRNASATRQEAAKKLWYFLPGGKIIGKYVYTPVLEGKTRWFTLESVPEAEEVQRIGEGGCRICCERQVLTRRGMNADVYLDPDQ